MPALVMQRVSMEEMVEWGVHSVHITEDDPDVGSQDYQNEAGVNR